MQVAHIVNVVGRAEPRQDQQQKRLHFPSSVLLSSWPPSLAAAGARPGPAPLHKPCHVLTISRP